MILQQYKSMPLLTIINEVFQSWHLSSCSGKIFPPLVHSISVRQEEKVGPKTFLFITPIFTGTHVIYKNPTMKCFSSSLIQALFRIVQTTISRCYHIYSLTENLKISHKIFDSVFKEKFVN